MIHSALTAGKERKLTKTKMYEEDLKHAEDLINDQKAYEEAKEDGESSKKVEDTLKAEGSSEDLDSAKENKDENSDNPEKNMDSDNEAAADKGEDADTKFLRLMADFQNFKKRAEKEKSDIYARANESLMLSLLTVIDNFERALDHESKDEKYAEGMHLIFKQLMDALKAAGLEEIKAEDEHFDPNIHNAVMTCDSEHHESGKVVEVMQKGYTLNGKLLRASMVKVNN